MDLKKNNIYMLNQTLRQSKAHVHIKTPGGCWVNRWLSSWLAEQEVRGSIPSLATWIFRDWLSPASKLRYAEIPLKRRKSSIQPIKHQSVWMKDANKTSFTNERYHSILQIQPVFYQSYLWRTQRGFTHILKSFVRTFYSLLAIYIMYSSSFNVDNW